MICGRLGQEEDGLAGRESRDRSASTELGTAEEARAQALEVSNPLFLLVLPSFSFLLHVFLGFLLFYFYFLAAGQDRRKGGGHRGSGDRAERHQGPV